MLQFPPSKQQPVDVFGKVIDLPLQKRYFRIFGYDSGDTFPNWRYTTLYTVPFGKVLTIIEAYRLYSGFCSAYAGFICKSQGVTDFVQIPMGNTVAATYGSVNYISGYPITLVGGDVIQIAYYANDLSGVLGFSLLCLEEDIKI